MLQPLLPEHPHTHPFGSGRPRRPDRECADAIFYVPRTGCQWKALDPTDWMPGSTAHDRFQKWVEARVFLKLWQVDVEPFDELKGMDWEWLSMDGAMTRAPLGGEDTGRNLTDWGKQGTKRSLLTEEHGVPIGLAVDRANRHDMKLARETIENIMVERPEPTAEHLQNLCLDKGYDDQEVRDTLDGLGFTDHIRSRGEEAKEMAQEAGKRTSAGGWSEPTVG